MSPQKLIEIMQFSNSIYTGTRRYSDKFLVRPHKFPIPTSIGCASPKLSLHTLVRKKKKTRVMSYQKRVGLAGDSHLHSLVGTFCQHFTENHYSFSTKYRLLLCIFLPPFNFSFMIKIGYYHIYSSYLSCSDTFATTIINIWPLKRKKKASEGGSAPSEAWAFNF